MACKQQHHIIPQALGGQDIADNLIRLSPAEHVKAHELLFNAYFEMTKMLGHIITSMSSDNKKLTYITDHMNNFNDTISRAYLMTKKRTVLDIETLTAHKIPALDVLPEGYVEKPDMSKRNNIKKIQIYKIINGKLIQRYWNDGVSIPQAWCSIKDATQDILDLLKKRTTKKSFPKKGSRRFVHNIITLKNKMISIADPLPEGYAEGIFISEETAMRQRLGGLKCKALHYSNANGYRYVHRLSDNKNVLIEKDKTLPEGYAEGMYMPIDKRLKQAEYAKLRKNRKSLSTS